MSQSAKQLEHPSADVLCHFVPLNSLPPDMLETLAQQLSYQHASRKDVLLKLGESEPTFLYLVEGEVELRAQDGMVRRIRHDHPSSQAPIARLRPSRYEVIARSPVTYLRVPESLLNNLGEVSDEGLDLHVVEEVEEGTLDVLTHQLVYRLYEALYSNQFILPSLPEIAVRVGKAVKHTLADAKRVAKVIENDPVITVKLIRVANSARYAGRSPVASLPDAIARLGLSTTYQLVLSFVLRELFRARSQSVKTQMQGLWKDARYVAAIGHVLARRCPSLDSETALLVGLAHNVGEVAALTYASEFPDLTADLEALSAAVSQVGPSIGPTILEKWQFPAMLVQAIRALGNDKDAQDNCDYGDLLVMARYQYRRRKDPDIPAPAVRIEIGDPEEVASILSEAEQEVQATLALLGD